MAYDHVREELVKYSGCIRSYLSRFNSNEYPVDDLVQDTFLQAFQSIQRQGPPAKPLPWLLTIAQRAGIAGLKQALKHRHATLFGDPAYNNTPGPIEYAEQREILNRIHDGMAQLRETDRFFLHEHYLEQRTGRELSQRHNLTYETTKVRLCRSRQRLRKILLSKKGGEIE